ncbi:MAG: hydratase [Aquabacterium sp.]|uniref:fumarylacetoacetate hydrolase family protein n=1 Tax=Aquabacterium sp. TaxID=1872578 RepID=UPI0011F78953|nr:fumarylacetoacetate hydrolase family protein [Aquabacterium sp.]TAK93914.1 MAG: hydratase [Aquabacterium sp.]
MNPISANAQAAAAILAQRRLQGLQGPCLPDGMRPVSLDEAMAIQRAVMPLMGDAVGGWKCGTPGPDKLVVAPIYASTIHRQADSAPCPVWASEGAVRVEPELAFVLGQDLPVRDQPYEPHEVDAALAATHLALELIDSRYNDPAVLSFADKLADGLVNQGLYIGPSVDGDEAALTRVMPIGVRVDAGGEQVRAGQHPDPLPTLPLYWLVEYLREQGVGLQAGQVVITGSYAGTFPMPVGPELAVRYGELGELRVRFQARVRT